MNVLPTQAINRQLYLIPNEEKNERIFLSTPHMTGNEQKYINEAFEANWIAPIGPNVNDFEAQMACYTGAKGAAALSSGTAAIHLAVDLLGIGKGDRVFCSSLTFVASANPILYAGAEPVFIDSEEETWNMSPEALQKAFQAADKEGKLPKAVIVVNLYGQSAKMDELLEICNEYDVPLIEDAAESLGSEYKGKKSGTLGKFGVYSFNGNKIITTSGGGMLISNDTELVIKARFLASQAKDPAPYYQHSEIGYNYRLSNVLAGIGKAQLEVIDDRVKARRAVFKRYEEALGDLSAISFQPELEETYSNRWLSVITIDSDRSPLSPHEIMTELEEYNIESRRVWKPLHMQDLFKNCAFFTHREEKPVSEVLFENGLCLPSGSNMTIAQQQRVIEKLKEILN